MANWGVRKHDITHPPSILSRQKGTRPRLLTSTPPSAWPSKPHSCPGDVTHVSSRRSKSQLRSKATNWPAQRAWGRGEHCSVCRVNSAVIQTRTSKRRPSAYNWKPRKLEGVVPQAARTCHATSTPSHSAYAHTFTQQ